jgi:hypothetical protein
MTQEQKDLLLKDLCVRLPYGVEVEYNSIKCEVLSIDKYNEELTIRVCPGYCPVVKFEDVKPFLFPLSSMTEEQREELYKIGWYLDEDKIYSCFRNYDDVNYKTHIDCFELINWCYKNNFDINSLIPMGLAEDATDKNIY